MSSQFICYSKCTTCKKARKWLESQKIEFEERPIKENNPTKEELLLWIEKSGYPIKKFFNTSGNLYKELNLKNRLPEMTKEEMIDLLSTDGMLVKRPIFLRGDKILVGFKQEEWESTI